MRSLNHSVTPWYVDRQTLDIFSCGNTQVPLARSILVDGSRDRQEVETNAHLMASAPYLLHVLDAIIYEVKGLAHPISTDSWLPDDLIKNAIRAITKAHGLTP